MPTIGGLAGMKPAWKAILDVVMPSGKKWWRKKVGNCARSCPHIRMCDGYGPRNVCSPRWRSLRVDQRSLGVIIHVLQQFDYYNAGDLPEYGGRSSAIVRLRRFLHKELTRIMDAERLPPPPSRNDKPQMLKYARRVRRGQKAFRERLLWLYDGKCAISGCGVSSVLEASHILPHARSGLNSDANGLLLRADIHYLLDDSLIRIRPKTLTVVVDRSLRGTPYWRHNGRALRRRCDGSRPSAEKLQTHWGKQSKKP